MRAQWIGTHADDDKQGFQAAMNMLIKSPADHAQAVQRLDALMARDPANGTPEGDELELLAHLIDGYEREHHDLGFPKPVEAIRFRMEQQGLEARDVMRSFWVPR